MLALVLPIVLVKESDAAQHKIQSSESHQILCLQQPNILFPNKSEVEGMETTQPLLSSDAGHSLGKSAALQLPASAVGISLGVHTPYCTAACKCHKAKKPPALLFFHTKLHICTCTWSSCPLTHKGHDHCRNVHKNIVAIRHTIDFPTSSPVWYCLVINFLKI